jgi:SAM-dependent methyltransferase
MRMTLQIASAGPRRPGWTWNDRAVDEANEPYYRPDLALIHHVGFGLHADATAPGILELLSPIRARGGLVVEIGCGSGLLTRYLVDAGHRVIATDASPAMLDLTRETVGDAEDIVLLTLPDDPIPAADAIVGVGHAQLPPRRGEPRPRARRDRRRAAAGRGARDRSVRPRMGGGSRG